MSHGSVQSPGDRRVLRDRFVRMVSALGVATPGDEAMMRRYVDAWWEVFGDHASSAMPTLGRTSWVGFYLRDAEAREGSGQELVLGPRRDKPACSPIGLHGACGQSFVRRSVLVVGDVKRLGEGYIACDPRDQAELVVACVRADGSCWGVLDVDSFDVGAFDRDDAAMALHTLRTCGLSAHADDTTPRLELI
jgi:putative methionine-R-sulfoxide reductase with GAF domain